MQAEHMFFPVTVAFAAMALSFAAGVYSAPALHKTSDHYIVADSGGSATTPDEFFDYFPSHYVNQATKIEELPAQF